MESKAGGSARHVSSSECASLKWLKLESLTYVDEEGKERHWEMVARTTRRKECVADAVSVLTVVKSSGGPDEIVFVRQYRPPVRGYTIELPAGLIDEGETPEEAAARELKEEAGLTMGRVVSSSPPTSLDAGVESALIVQLVVEVDGDLATNREAKKVEQEGEHTEVFRVPLSQCAEFLRKSSGLGDVVDSRVWSLFGGMHPNLWK